MSENVTSNIASQRDLLERISAAAPQKIQNRDLHFRNNDVPEYLSNLRKFHEESGKTEVTIK
jgi:hypothetical protein